MTIDQQYNDTLFYRYNDIAQKDQKVQPTLSDEMFNQKHNFAWK